MQGDDDMAETMTASEIVITAGQIAKINENLAAALRKSGFSKDPVQKIIETQGDALVAEMVEPLRRRVEAISGFIVRRISVNRARTPKEAIDATGRQQYVTDSVVETMPHGEGEEAEVHFFNLDRYVSDSDLDKEYELRGLKPADPYSLAAVNEADPAFADEYPNSTQWKDANSKWCYAAFYRWHDGRYVYVYRSVDDWDAYWWFAGVRK